MTDTIPAGARILLDLIYRTETGRGAPACYRTIYGHREGGLKRPITDMTLDELMAAQKGWGRKWGSSAAGAPQIIAKTMRGLVRKLGLTGKEKYDAAMQDRMAFALLRGRGWEKFAAGEISLVEFGNRLAREWASFPVLTAQQGAHGRLKRGQSYYDGDGMNSALISPAKVEAALQQALKAAQWTPEKPADAPVAPEAPEPVPTPKPAPAPAPESNSPVPPKKEQLSTSKRFWTWLVTLVTALGTLADKIGWADLDWRVQIALLAVVALLAVYGIGSMPRARQLLGRLAGWAS